MSTKLTNLTASVAKQEDRQQPDDPENMCGAYALAGAFLAHDVGYLTLDHWFAGTRTVRYVAGAGYAALCHAIYCQTGTLNPDRFARQGDDTIPEYQQARGYNAPCAMCAAALLGGADTVTVRLDMQNPFMDPVLQCYPTQLGHAAILNIDTGAKVPIEFQTVSTTDPRPASNSCILYAVMVNGGLHWITIDESQYVYDPGNGEVYTDWTAYKKASGAKQKSIGLMMQVAFK